jgi:hypothetical protein
VYHVTIENTNEMAYKDIKVKVRYYSGSYSSAGTTEIGESMCILHVTLPPHSKRTYLEKGVALQQGSACGLYLGAADMKILGAIPVSYSLNSAN